MNLSSQRLAAALSFSLFAHAVVLLAFLLAPSAPVQKAEASKDIFVTIENLAPPTPKPLPPPAPVAPEVIAPPTPPTPPKAASRPPPAKATPTPSAPPVDSVSSPEANGAVAIEDNTTSEDSSASGEEGSATTTGDDPNTTIGNGGASFNLKPGAQLSLGEMGAILGTKSRGPGPRSAFVKSQLGGPLGAPASLVGAGNQRRLTWATAEPFLAYLNVMHQRIHKQWAEGALKSFEQLECDSPFNNSDLAVTLEIVLDADGSLERAATIVGSGLAAFDAAAVTAIYDAGPFPKAPKEILSYDDKVYLQWTLHRDERQCGIAYAQTFLLTNAIGEPNPAEVASTSTPFTEATTTPTRAASQPTTKPGVAELLAGLEKPPPPNAFGIQAFVTNYVVNCKEKITMRVDNLKDTISDLKAHGLVSTFKSGVVDRFHHIEIKLPITCVQDAPQIFIDENGFQTVLVKQLPDGPLDEITFPPCEPSCKKVCF